MADQISGLNYKLTVDPTQFTSGLATSTQNLQRFATDTQASAGRVGAAFSGIGSQVGSSFQALASGGPLAAIGSLQSGIAGIGSSLLGAIGPAGLLAGALTAGFAAIAVSAQSAVKEINSINKLARVLGETGQNTQVLSRVFEQNGLGAEDAQRILLKFQNVLGEIRANPKAEVAKDFERIGLDPEILAQQNLRDALGDTLEALNRLGGGNQRANASQAIFGKGAIDLAEIISKGRAAIDIAQRSVERYGVTAGQLDLSRDIHEQQKELEQNGLNVGALVSRAWDTVRLKISGALTTLQYGAYDALGLIDHAGAAASQANRLAARNGPVSATATLDATALSTRRADRDAESLLEKWTALQGEIGLSARQIEIVRLQERAVSDAQVQRLYAADALIVRREEEVARTKEELALRKQIYQQLRSQHDISLAITGIDAGSIEAAKLTANIQTRINNGIGNPEQDQARSLAAVEDILARQLAATQETNRLLGTNGRVSAADI